MDRKSILEQSIEIVTKDRNTTYGEPEDSFTTIAGLWSAYTGQPFTPQDVAVMMALLKVARIKNSPQTLDNWIDLAGYAACGGGMVEPA